MRNNTSSYSFDIVELIYFMKKTFLALFLSLSFLFIANIAHAADSSSCQIIYGGGQVCPTPISFIIEKRVLKPVANGEFVNNLTINDPKFAPGQSINFQIILQNTGSSRIDNVEVVDTLPQIINFDSGAGSFDPSTRTLKFIVTSLEPGQSVASTFTGRIVDASSLPQDKGIVCATNEAKATVQNVVASSTSQFCVEKPTQIVVTPLPKKVFTTPVITQTPPTGPELLPLIGFASSGVLGYFLRKKTKVS